MEAEELRRQLGPGIRTLQIIVAAVTLGPLLFLLMIPLIRAEQADGPAGNLLTYAALAVTVAAALARLMVPPLLLSGARKRIAAERRVEAAGGSQLRAAAWDEARQLYGAYTARTIVAVAILEGAALFLLVAYLLEGRSISLVVALAVIFAMAAHLPRREQVLKWLEDQLRLLDAERQLGMR